ncbi:MAG: glycosyltransferase family 39 protein [Candidatus Kapabacteria bacterium]|nr:glycosyltransferase family 39 protein [Candidatus Kapabacteria bacterium]
MNMIKRYINKNNLPVIIIFSCLFIYLVSGFNYDYKIYDEGIAVYGANRVAEGEVPYRDFWSIYPPGQYYLLSLIFKFFGFELISERIFSILIFFLTSIILYRISFNLTKSSISIISPVVYIFFISYSTMYGTAMGTSILLAVTSFYLFHKWLSTRKLKFLIFSGFFSGLTSIFRLDIGTYAFFSNLLILIIYNTQQKLSIKIWIKNLLFLVLAFILVFIPVYLTLIITSGFNNVFEQLIIFPSKIFTDYRSLPFPNPFDVFSIDASITTKLNILWTGKVFYLPLLIYVITIIITYIKNQEKINIEKLTTIHLVIAGLLFYLQASIRSDIEHLLPTLFISSILIVYLIYKFGKNIWIKTIFAILTLFLISVPIYKKFEQNTQKLVLLKIPRLNGILVDQVKAYELNSIYNFFKENVHYNEKIFVGNSKHDLIYINDVMMYFLLNHPAGTKYHELSPGQATTKNVQLEIIRDLQKNKVKYVILRKEEIQSSEKNLSSISSGITLLDDYLDINYKEVFSTPNYTVKKFIEEEVKLE